MLNTIWCGMLLAAIAAAFAAGKTTEITNAFGEGAQAAVTLSFSMLGVMCFWTGMLRVAEAAGLMKKLARLFSPVTRLLFGEYREHPAVTERIALAFSANLLGMGNAATPLGIAAMQEMHRLSPAESPTPGAQMFVIVSTASLQLLPTYAVTLRSHYGSASPYDILPCVWIVSAASLAVCIAAGKWMAAYDR